MQCYNHLLYTSHFLPTKVTLVVGQHSALTSLLGWKAAAFSSKKIRYSIVWLQILSKWHQIPINVWCTADPISAQCTFWCLQVKSKMLDSQNESIRQLKSELVEAKGVAQDSITKAKALESDWQQRLQEEVDQARPNRYLSCNLRDKA